ncbi:Bcr/CflA family efflux MFS transporter [Jiella endophytica]|uniref:Bcr/CflA family efflux transporter n=1 Tax=Jiella endophytica TaxID=2558362 RepID=A0A4Y8RAB6_9HYPH|nr:multidrug effflux MFS transporter [Jiella endophytica]TFF17976.1 Bcr/CflA family efflux MFS transporter [Jiella endophytica]
MTATRDAHLPDAGRTVRRPMLVTLMIASALSPLAINIFIPSMASIARDLVADEAIVGLGLSLYLAATALIQLLAGPLSDRYGRRPVIIGGMVLYLVGTVMCLAAADVVLFLAGRVVQAASATGIALSRAIVRDVYERERAAAMIGYVTMGFAIAPLLGPLIGGTIDTAFGWRMVFWLLAAIGIVAIGLLFVDLNETNPERGKPMRGQLANYAALLTAGSFWNYAMVSALISAVFFAFLGGAPFVAASLLGMTPAEYGLWFALCAAGYIIGNFITAQLSERLGIKTLMVAGSAISMGAALLSLALVGAGWLSPLTLFGPMFLVGIGNGLATPTSTAGGVSVVPHAAGAAAGMMGALQIGTGALASFAAALVATRHGGPIGLLALMSVFGLGSLVAAMLVRRVRHTA